MPIGISDQRTERIKPPKVASVFISETSSVPQSHGRPGPGVSGIVVNRRQTQHRNTSAHSDAIKSFALKKTVRGGLDNVRVRCGYAAGRHHVQRDRFEHEQIAPAPGDRIACTSARGEFHEHVPPINENPELWPLATCGRPRRMSRDRGCCEFRVVIPRLHNILERLPAGKRFIADDEIASQILTTPRHRDQNVVIGPISQARRKPEIGVSRSKVSSQESRRARIGDLYRETVRHRAGRHPDRLPRDQCDELACRPGRPLFGHPKQRKARRIKR